MHLFIRRKHFGSASLCGLLGATQGILNKTSQRNEIQKELAGLKQVSLLDPTGNPTPQKTSNQAAQKHPQPQINKQKLEDRCNYQDWGKPRGQLRRPLKTHSTNIPRATYSRTHAAHMNLDSDCHVSVISWTLASHVYIVRNSKQSQKGHVILAILNSYYPLAMRAEHTSIS